MSGDGTILNPLDMATALQIARPGHTFIVRAGTYSGDITFARSGQPGKPITFKAYPGERPIIDGNFTLNGNYVDWVGFDHVKSAFTNRTADSGGSGIDVSGNNCRIINCTIHDFSQGITSGKAVGVGLQVIGCLLFHNGWTSNLGHGVYPQNNGPTEKLFRDCFNFDNYGYGFHFYTSSGNVNNFTLQGNVAFNNGSVQNAAYPNVLFDASGAIESPVLRNNVMYHGVAASHNYIGDGSNPTNDIDIHDNMMVRFPGNGTSINLRGNPIDIARLDGNTFIGATAGFTQGSWPDNTYLANMPTVGQWSSLRVNPYDANRASLAVFNWADANSIAIDVTAVFNEDDSLLARNVQDYWNDTLSLSVSGGNISIDMQAANRTVATPLGGALAPAKTFPRFGCFVLERTS